MKIKYKRNKVYAIVAKRDLEDGTEKIRRYEVRGKDIDNFIKEKLNRAKYYWIEKETK